MLKILLDYQQVFETSRECPTTYVAFLLSEPWMNENVSFLIAVFLLESGATNCGFIRFSLACSHFRLFAAARALRRGGFENNPRKLLKLLGESSKECWKPAPNRVLMMECPETRRVENRITRLRTCKKNNTCDVLARSRWNRSYRGSISIENQRAIAAQVWNWSTKKDSSFVQSVLIFKRRQVDPRFNFSFSRNVMIWLISSRI